MGKTAQDREMIDRPRRMSKIDAGQGDASRDASPCSIEPLHMTSALHIVCPHCDSINRVPRERLRDGGKCGSCHQPIFERRPVALNSVARFSRLPLLSASY
jgi:hypothetical protein